MGKINILYLSSYPPRICGIGSFTRDLISVTTKSPKVNSVKVIALERGKKHQYGEEVIYSFPDNSPVEFENAAKFINDSNFEVVSLQHEFGLYSGEMGEDILYLTEKLKKPMVTTFHMISPQPTQKQLYIVQKIAKKSSFVVALSDFGKKDLVYVYKLPKEKVKVIPHGGVDIERKNTEEAKRKLGIQGKRVLTSINIIRESRGIDLVIQSLPKILKKFPETIFLVLGTDPEDVPKPNPYRTKLENMVLQLNLSKKVFFENRYIPLEELSDYLSATDILLTPYRPPEQSSSGTLAYGIVAGKVCLSTPYSYARFLLSKGRGVIVPWENSEKIAEKVIELFSSPEKMEQISQKAYNFGRKMIWENVARKYINLFVKGINQYV